MKVPGGIIFLYPALCSRKISTSAPLHRIRDLKQLSNRSRPSYQQTQGNDLLSLQWASPLRNILLVKKLNTPQATSALIEFAQHVHASYPNISIILEPDEASSLHTSFSFPVYSPQSETPPLVPLSEKVDLTATFGGDGTILHASSLFATTSDVPPILSFSMGTLGFLGEWKFSDYKSAFREVYMSGAESKHCMDKTRNTRVLLRNRLKVVLYTITSPTFSGLSGHEPLIETYALNEIILHRGATPHLAHISVSIGGRHLTHAIADGLIISTPTGSTAYNLSSGGSIIHPLVPSLLLTPVCPRSLSFRPLVLPGNMPINLRLGEGNRGSELEVSVDGVRRHIGLGSGTEVKVIGEEVGTIDGEAGGWRGGVPCLVRSEKERSDSWVVGLNGLLKFNLPFGEEGEGQEQ